MKGKVRKKYEKPTVTKVGLEARVSVLAVCKTTNQTGPPTYSGCVYVVTPCEEIGS
jgi:hypothetical protein